MSRRRPSEPVEDPGSFLTRGEFNAVIDAKFSALRYELRYYLLGLGVGLLLHVAGASPDLSFLGGGGASGVAWIGKWWWLL